MWISISLRIGDGLHRWDSCNTWEVFGLHLTAEGCCSNFAGIHGWDNGKFQTSVICIASLTLWSSGGDESGGGDRWFDGKIAQRERSLRRTGQGWSERKSEQWRVQISQSLFLLMLMDVTPPSWCLHAIQIFTCPLLFFFFLLHLIPELYFDYMDYSSSYWPAAITGQYRSRKSWNQEHSISDDSPRAFLCDVRCTLGSLHQMCTGKGRKFNLANDCPVLWAVHAKIRSSEGSCRG